MASRKPAPVRRVAFAVGYVLFAKEVIMLSATWPRPLKPDARPDSPFLSRFSPRGIAARPLRFGRVSGLMDLVLDAGARVDRAGGAGPVLARRVLCIRSDLCLIRNPSPSVN